MGVTRAQKKRSFEEWWVFLQGTAAQQAAARREVLKAVATDDSVTVAKAGQKSIVLRWGALLKGRVGAGRKSDYVAKWVRKALPASCDWGITPAEPALMAVVPAIARWEWCHVKVRHTDHGLVAPSTGAMNGPRLRLFCGLGCFCTLTREKSAPLKLIVLGRIQTV